MNAMSESRRRFLQHGARTLCTAAALSPWLGRTTFGDPLPDLSGTNPIMPGAGLCDPHVRVYDDEVYLYATHDSDPRNTGFVTRDWWVWHTVDLVHWKQVSTLRPEQTYWRKPSTACWATDSMRRNGKYYL